MNWKHHLERVVGRGRVGAVEVPLPGGVADVLEVEVDALVAVLGHHGGPAGGAAGGAGRRPGDGELPAGDGAAGEALHGHGLHGDGGGEGGHGARTGCCWSLVSQCVRAYVHKLNPVDRIVLRIWDLFGRLWPPRMARRWPRDP